MTDSSIPTAQNRGHIRASMKPGALQVPWLGSTVCHFVPIATAPREWKGSWRDTAPYEVFEAYLGDNPLQSTMFVVYQGRIGLVFVDYRWLGEGDRDTFCEIPKG